MNFLALIEIRFVSRLVRADGTVVILFEEGWLYFILYYFSGSWHICFSRNVVRCCLIPSKHSRLVWETWMFDRLYHVTSHPYIKNIT